MAETLTYDLYESAGISGFDRAWNTPVEESHLFDAIHRRALVRFPGSAEALAAKLNEGYAIRKAEVVLDYAGYESTRSIYTMADTKIWAENPPEWHVQAWALRRPWAAPTFNAAIGGVEREAERLKGLKAAREPQEANVSLLASQPSSLSALDDGGAIVYWTRFGAQDEEHDRYPTVIGPEELSHLRTEARLDVTALLTEEEYGKTLGERLARFEACGLILKKLEDYDYRYRCTGWGDYEWNTHTGGLGLRFQSPRLVVEIEARSKVEGGKVEAEKISAGGSP